MKTSLSVLALLCLKLIILVVVFKDGENVSADFLKSV